MESDPANETEATTAAWGLALTRDHRSLYAANSALGIVAELNLEDFAVTRTAVVPQRTGSIELAKFESGEWHDAGSVALSPDDKVLYVGGPHGISALATADLALTGTLGGDRGYRSIAVGAEGDVYAVDSGGGLYRLGTAAKPIEAVLARDGFTVIEGVVTLR
jgi:hypothetical protein